MPTLFDPIQIGPLSCPNRIWMAPLTRGQAELAAGSADAIAFGRKFLANPDLPQRFAADLPLNSDDQNTWYSRGPEGYITYPTAS